jgi:hypothetical protein
MLTFDLRNKANQYKVELTFRFLSDPSTATSTKTSQRVDPQAFQQLEGNPEQQLLEHQSEPSAIAAMATPHGILRLICSESAELNHYAVAAVHRCDSGGASPAQTAGDPRKTLDFARYIQLSHMRLVVVFERFWLAILRKEKLIEFRSSNQPILLEAGQCLLFALAMLHRRNGKDSLLAARVLKVELLDVDQAREAYPQEAEACNLNGLAVEWGVTTVRCIVLDKDSIRIADEIANLSAGCQGIVHQFALKTGVPHFCHVSDLGKTVSFTLPSGKLVLSILRRPVSSPDRGCDLRERSADETTSIVDASKQMAEGEGDPLKALLPKRGDDKKYLQFCLHLSFGLLILDYPLQVRLSTALFLSFWHLLEPSHQNNKSPLWESWAM